RPSRPSRRGAAKRGLPTREPRFEPPNKHRNARVSQLAAQDVINNPPRREDDEPIGQPSDIRSRAPREDKRGKTAKPLLNRFGFCPMDLKGRVAPRAMHRSDATEAGTIRAGARPEPKACNPRRG